MSWFKIDDGFWSHPKVLGLSDAAVALWVKAGSYSGQHLTDGVITRKVLQILSGSQETASELVSAGLWLDHIEGYCFHDWDKYQPLRKKVEAEREKTKERVAKYREKKSPIYIPVPSRPSLRVTNGVGNGVTTPLPPSFNEVMQELKRKVAGDE